MSYATIHQAANDQALMDRVQACVLQQAEVNPTLSLTDYAEVVRKSPTSYYLLVWPVAVDTEAAYESAVIGGNPNPGGDPSVITDAAILSSVQASWPPNEAPA